MLNEVLSSVVAGRPIWNTALVDCQHVPNETLTKMHEAVQNYIQWGNHRKVNACPC